MNKEQDKVEQLAKMPVESQLIFKILKQAVAGDKYSFEDLRTIGGLNRIPSSANINEYRILRKARLECESYGIQFKTVKTENFHGLMCMSHEQCVDNSRRFPSAIKSRANHEAKKLVALPYDKFDQQTKVEWNSNLTYCQFLKHISSTESIHKIDEKSEKYGGTLPSPQEIAELFGAKESVG